MRTKKEKLRKWEKEEETWVLSKIKKERNRKSKYVHRDKI